MQRVIPPKSILRKKIRSRCTNHRIRPHGTLIPVVQNAVPGSDSLPLPQ